MSAGRITSPSSIKYAIKRGPDKSRLSDSWKYRFDDSVKIDCIFQLVGIHDGDIVVGDFNVQIEKLDWTIVTDVIEFSGFIPGNGMTITGRYNVVTREGEAELSA
jgi:hypothetical protein